MPFATTLLVLPSSEPVRTSGVEQGARATPDPVNAVDGSVSRGSISAGRDAENRDRRASPRLSSPGRPSIVNGSAAPRQIDRGLSS
jgi:hypothetical protein